MALENKMDLEQHKHQFALGLPSPELEVVVNPTGTDQGMTESIKKTGYKSAAIRFTGATAIPFIVAPAIDYDFTIQLSRDENTGSIIYTIQGAHDGFPAYEIFIGTENVYFHTPKVEQNQSPLSPFNKGQTLFLSYPQWNFP